MAHEIYMNMGTIPGECIEEHHKNWINVDSFSCSVSAAGNDQENSGACRHSPIEINKHIDRSSPKLALAACMRTRLAVVYLDICQQTNAKGNDGSRDESQVVVLKCTLTGVTCLSYNLNGEDHSTDSISISYDKIQWRYTYLDPFDLEPEGTYISYWDTLRNAGG